MAERNLEIIIKAQDFASKEVKKMQKEVKKLEGNFKKTGKAISGATKSLKDMGPAFQKMAGFGTAAFAGLGLGMKKLVNQASDLEETTQKFNVVYRDLQDESNKAAKQIAKDFGLSQRASKQFLADLGDMTSGFGLSQEASLEYASSVTKLGVDLASFANIAGGSEEAVDRLNKGFLGEHENLKALGIVINQTILDKQLLADGTAHLTGLELEAAKIQARQRIAMRQSANAIGDFERSKASLANQSRILQANMEDLTTELGNALLPAVTEITTALVPVIQKFAKWATENQELVKIIAITVLAITGLIAVFGTLGLVLPAVITGVKLLGGALMFLAANPIGLLIVAIGALIATIALWVTHWDELKQTITIIATLIKRNVVETFTELKSDMISIGQGIRDGFIGWIDNMVLAIKEKVTAVMAFVKKQVDKAKAMLASISSKVSNSFKNIGANVKTAAGLDGTRARGGPVQTGKTFLVGEKGPELFTPQSSGNITPNNKLGGGGATVNINMGNVNVNNESDANMLADKIRQVLINDSRLFNTGIS